MAEPDLFGKRKRRSSRPQRKRERLIRRALADDNFIHVVRMFPLMRMWAEGLEEGAEVDFNARNMVHMPVEIAEAFIRAHAFDISDLGRACRDVTAAIDAGGIRGLTKLYRERDGRENE